MQQGADASLAEVKIGKADCPSCGKRNSLVRYANDSAQCFNRGCGYREGHRPDTRPKADPIPRGLLRPDGASYSAIRGVGADTLRRYGAFLGGYKGARQLVVPIYDNTGVMVAQQVRMKDGTAEIVGERGTGRQLLGQHVYGDRNDKRVVVHSDAVDMMSTGQVMRLRAPCVSVLSDANGAIRDFKENYRWLDRFEEIVLFFQDTPEWQQASQSCASLFPAGKVKIALLGEHRSANEALQAGRPGDIENAVYAATPWRPLGIVNAKEGRELLFKEGLQVPSWPYPWDEFNESTMGIRPGECTYHVAGTGVAKTTLMFHYAVKLLKWDGKSFLPDQPDFPVQAPCKLGWMGFEDLTKQVKVGMLGIHAGKMLSLEPVTEEEGLALYDDLFGDGRLELYDPEQAEYALDAVLSYTRYMAKALDCRVIFFDPLSFIVSQLPVMQRTQEEEKLAAKLAAEAKTLGVSFQISYHLKKPDGTPFEEGRRIGLSDIKGSGALSHYAHNVLAYGRNQQGDRPDLLFADSLKNRYARYTGEICILKYDMQTGRYEPTDETWPDDTDQKKRKASKDKGGFTSSGDY
jgi:twinkle protein